MSRTDHAEIDARDWFTVGGEESVKTYFDLFDRIVGSIDAALKG